MVNSSLYKGDSAVARLLIHSGTFYEYEYETDNPVQTAKPNERPRNSQTSAKQTNAQTQPNQINRQSKKRRGACMQRPDNPRFNNQTD